MAKSEGRLQTLLVGPSEDPVEGIVDGSVTIDTKLLNATTHDSGSFEEFEYGRSSGSISVKGRWDDAGVGIALLQDAALTKTKLAAIFRMEDGVGLTSYEGTILVESFGLSGPNDDLSDYTASMKFTGTIANTPQT